MIPQSNQFPSLCAAGSTENSTQRKHRSWKASSLEAKRRGNSTVVSPSSCTESSLKPTKDHTAVITEKFSIDHDNLTVKLLPLTNPLLALTRYGQKWKVHYTGGSYSLQNRQGSRAFSSSYIVIPLDIMSSLPSSDFTRQSQLGTTSNAPNSSPFNFQQ